MKKNDANEWLEVLAREIGGRVDVVPRGWVTREDVQRQFDFTDGQAEVFVNKAIRLGKMQKKKFRIKTKIGIKEIWHYNKKK
jgi:hypothetical protein